MFYKLVTRPAAHGCIAVVQCSFHSVPKDSDFLAFTHELSRAVHGAETPFALVFSITVPMLSLPLSFAREMSQWMAREEDFLRAHLRHSHVFVPSWTGKKFVDIVLHLKPSARPCFVHLLSEARDVDLGIRA